MTSSVALLNSRTSLMIRPSKVRPSRGGFFLEGGERGGRVGERKASPSYFSECDEMYASKGYIPFGQIVYTLGANSIYPSKKRYIPSFQMLYYFSLNVILLSDGSYITSLRMLLYFLQEVEVLSVKSRGISERK